MTDRGTKALIGAFVLGAVALLAILTLLLGSGLMGNRNPTFALFFKTSLKGLVQGSPVYFKGIRIGKVKSINILPLHAEDTFVTPV
ncbi:MAG: MCE family protein, partial [Mailhella sp.]|nr:MCE family protein [Mailhella sp.]